MSILLSHPEEVPYSSHLDFRLVNRYRQSACTVSMDYGAAFEPGGTTVAPLHGRHRQRQRSAAPLPSAGTTGRGTAVRPLTIESSSASVPERKRCELQ